MNKINKFGVSFRLKKHIFRSGFLRLVSVMKDFMIMEYQDNQNANE